MFQTNTTVREDFTFTVKASIRAFSRRLLAILNRCVNPQLVEVKFGSQHKSHKGHLLSVFRRQFSSLALLCDCEIFANL